MLQSQLLRIDFIFVNAKVLAAIACASRAAAGHDEGTSPSP